MMRFLKLGCYLAILMLLKACNTTLTSSSEDSKRVELEQIDTAAIQAVQYEALFKEFQQGNDTLYVVNFWATWCLPCVKELPEFMQVNKELKGKKPFRMILVSLDPAAALSSKVKPFIVEKALATTHYLLDDVNRSNEWMKLIDNSWTGSIPATVMYKRGKQVSFTEGTLTASELTELIHQHLNNNN